MTELPIDASLPRIIEALSGRAAVVVAPPGSGKTTRVPPAILDAGLVSPSHPAAIVLQPRRVAARAAAARIAWERGWALGEEVGYHVRFDRRISRKTRLRFLTEGILTRQLLADPFLEGVGAVILDEFHERNLNSDLALALLVEIKREVRPDLILVVMSATLDAEPVARFLNECPIVRAKGRTHDLVLEYRSVSRPASAPALVPIIEEVLREPHADGHVLVFLPGLAEIRRLAKHIEPLAERAGAVVLPLHGSMSAGEQDRALEPSDHRKVILSTNVAETSLTIDGVSTVIDSGLARTVRYDADRGIDRWELTRISRASADQRAGRAARTGPGRCIRLWSERDQRGLPEFEQPEVHRIDLCATVLALYAWGATAPARFGWFDPPAAERLAAAERLLILLGALSAAPTRITPLGREMLSMPIHPRLARLLIEARQCGRVRDGATVAALLSERDIQVREARAAPSFKHGRESAAIGRSDILDRLDKLAEAEAGRFAPSLRSRGIEPGAARQVALLRDDLLKQARSRQEKAAHTHDIDDDEAVLKWLLLAYPDRVVKRRGAERTGVMVGGRGVRLSDQSVLRNPDLFLAIDAREDRRAGLLEVQVNLASAIEPEWLEEFFAGDIRQEQATRYDESRRRVICANQVWYQDLLLREDSSAGIDSARAGLILAEALRPEAADLIRGNTQAAVWLARCDFVRLALPELKWPEFDDEKLATLLDLICHGRTSRDEVESTDIVPVLQGHLNSSQLRELHESAPQSLTIPSGRSAKLTYEPGRPPILAVRLQELFGWTETPRLARGRVPVLLHLLGPNNRPVQITNDLRSFWTTTYHQVRKDLRARYPKHPWPPDPFSAVAPQRGRRS
jgi:ATP-dependent helicase HrpB